MKQLLLSLAATAAVIGGAFALTHGTARHGDPGAAASEAAPGALAYAAVLQLVPREGREQAVLELVSHATAAFEGQPGMLQYLLVQRRPTEETPTAVSVITTWRNEADFKAFTRTPVFEEFHSEERMGRLHEWSEELSFDRSDVLATWRADVR